MGSKLKNDCDGSSSFVMLPNVVISSPGYRAASHTARSLLLDIAHQFNGKNNGKLTASAKYLKPLGWNSPSVIVNALRDLQDLGLLVQTRQGGLNWPSWYAMTWRGLQQVDGLDIDPRKFPRGAYMRPGQVQVRRSHGGVTDLQIASSSTPGVADKARTATPGVVSGLPAATPGVAVAP